MHSKDKPVVWENPVTGEYRIPGRNDAPMPSYYQMRGFVRREFDSYFEHQAWCKKHELVNHGVEGISVDRDALDKNKWGY